MIELKKYIKVGKTTVRIDEMINLIKKYGLSCRICKKGTVKFVSEGDISSVENKKYYEAYCMILKCPRCEGSMNFIYDSENNSVKITPPVS
ncbi:MAG: hypothetical protein NTU58_04070 [Candidatus Nealsonbacteria bacterium]|nr:hypothetical protein [Candidatus Nealsonbacteria bacterium]